MTGVGQSQQRTSFGSTTLPTSFFTKSVIAHCLVPRQREAHGQLYSMSTGACRKRHTPALGRWCAMTICLRCFLPDKSSKFLSYNSSCTLVKEVEKFCLIVTCKLFIKTNDTIVASLLFFIKPAACAIFAQFVVLPVFF